MSEIFITWSVILPAFFIERIIIGLLGAGIFAHFICMASAAPVKSPVSVMVFLMLIVGSSVGMVVTAIFGDVWSMAGLLITCLASIFLFWLWLWAKGLHVKDFLEKKYGNEMG